MISTDKFQKGDKVKMSPLGLERLKPLKSSLGTVIGFSRDPHLVWIRKDGCKNASSYYMGFWSLITQS